MLNKEVNFWMSPTCTVWLHLIIVDISCETHSPSIKFVCRATKQGTCTEPILEALYNTSALIRNLANFLYLPKTFADKNQLCICSHITGEHSSLQASCAFQSIFLQRVFVCTCPQLNEKTT